MTRTAPFSLRVIGRRIAAAGAALAAGLPELSAHGTEVSPVLGWRSWELEPAVVALLFFFGATYAAGIRNLRRATGQPGKLGLAPAWFAAGWAVLALALLSPVHTVSRVLFWVHMTQHELLMVVAAPLVVLGRPWLVLLWALPRPAAARLVGRGRAAGLAAIVDALTRPLAAFLAHTLALWLWHVPTWFEATLRSEWVHGLQHGTFLGTALLFWQAVLFGPRRTASYGLAVGYLFLTALHSGALGALLTFATRPWYPAYTATTSAWGVSALEDQQLGGLIMWIPAGLVYVAAALALFAGWLGAGASSVASRQPLEKPASGSVAGQPGLPALGSGRP